MVTISGFSQTTDNPFVLFPSSSGGNDKTYFNGLTTSGSTGNYYYNQGNVYVFHRIGDFSSATGSITIDPGSSVTAYLVGGGGNNCGGGGGYTKSTFTATSSPYNISIGGSATETTFGSYTAAAGTTHAASNIDSGVGKKFVDNSLGYTYFYGGGGGGGYYETVSLSSAGGNGYNSNGGYNGGGGGGYSHNGGDGGGFSTVSLYSGAGGGGGFNNVGGNGYSGGDYSYNGGNGGGPNGGNGGGPNPAMNGFPGGAGGGGGGASVGQNAYGGAGGLLGGGGGGGSGGGSGGNGGAGGGGGGGYVNGGNGGAGGGGGGGYGKGGNGGIGGGGGGYGGNGGNGGNGGVGLLVLVITSSTSITCFLYNSKILTNKGYRPIQDLQKGDLVKTLKHYYKPIYMIGKKNINHIASQERIKNQLYKCSKKQYPELNEDLIITGCHAILENCFYSEEQREKVIEINGDTFVTDQKYRIPACTDDRASVYEKPGNYTVYHLALENEDYFSNYGIFANGLLVETISKYDLKEYAKMELIE